MLRDRILTAAVLIPLLIAALFYLPLTLLAALLGGISALGAVEWAALAGCSKRCSGWYGGATFVVLVVVWYLMHLLLLVPVMVTVTGGVFWLWAGARIFSYQRGGNAPALNGRSWCVIGWLILVPSWTALLWVRQMGGAGLLLLLFGLIWSADISAYFTGRRFGRRKLAHRVSPGKSWEGALGAAVATLVVGLGGAWCLDYSGVVLIWFALLGLLTCAASIIGDLLESLYKRSAGVKDSGTLLPGHGGVLDRVDSLTCAAPIFALGVATLNGWA